MRVLEIERVGEGVAITPQRSLRYSPITYPPYKAKYLGYEEKTQSSNTLVLRTLGAQFLLYGGNMKTLIKSLLVVLLVIMNVGLFACNKNVDEVVIKVEKNYQMERDDTLEDYMDYLEDKGKLDYEEEDGMIVSINGKKNTLNSYWMIYTDDATYSNSSWGTYEYKGKTLGSATLGAMALPLNKDATYVFVYQTF